MPTTQIERVIQAAACTLAQRWASGNYWIRGSSAHSTSRFVVDVNERRCASVMGFLLDGSDDMFWQRVISVGRDTYFPLGNEVFGADPRVLPDRHTEWIKTTGVDFPSAPPVTPLYWLAGTTAAQQVDSQRFKALIGRAESIEAASAEERDGVAETWEQLETQEEARLLRGAECMVELTDHMTIRSVVVDDAPGHRLTVEYEDLGVPVEIPTPDHFESVNIAELLAKLGVPELMPPSARDNNSHEAER